MKHIARNHHLPCYLCKTEPRVPNRSYCLECDKARQVAYRVATKKPTTIQLFLAGKIK